MSIFEKNEARKALALVEHRIKYAASYYGSEEAKDYVPMLRVCRDAIKEALKQEPKDGDVMTKEGEMGIIEYVGKDGSLGHALAVFNGKGWAVQVPDDGAAIVRWGRVPNWATSSPFSRKEGEDADET